MKRLTERTEIARAINFGEYPVLTIDLSERDEYGLKGCRVNIDCGRFRSGERYYLHADIRVFRGEYKLVTSAGCTCLSNSFGYSDIHDMVEMANAPVIRAEQEVVLVIYDSKNKKAYAPYILKTGSHIDKFCITPLTFEDVDFSEYFKEGGGDNEKEER